MKKYLLLSALICVMVLFTGCPHKTEEPKEEEKKTTVLNIKNQTSFSIKDIKYNDQTMSLLQIGSSCKVQLAEKANGYLYFTLYDETKNISFSVRTNNTIIVEKGETQIFSITDNTLVIQTRQTQPIRIYDLMNIAILKVYNKTSFDIVEISYSGTINKNTLSIGSEWEKNFTESMNDELSIKILRKKDNKLITFILKDEIKVKIGSIKEVIITNTTLVTEEGKTEIRELRYILEMGILNVINQTSANKISNLNFAGKVQEDLPKGSTWSIEFDTSVENNLFFTLETEVGSFEVRTEEKIQLINSEKTFTITDDTLVILNYRTNAYKIRAFLNAAGIEITNNSTYTMYNVTFCFNNFNTLNPKHSTGKWRYWEFTQELTPVSFEIYAYSQAIQLTTQERFKFYPRRTTEITITDSTLVKYKGSVVQLASFHQ